MTSSAAHVLASRLVWKSASEGYFPLGAVEGGYGLGYGSRNEPLYVARVLAPDGKYHPAKFSKSRGHGAHYYYNGREATSMTYDVLAVSADDVVTLKWVNASDGKIPAYAVQGERNDLYIGRHLMPEYNELVIGEVSTVESKCIVVTYWKVFKYAEYEVLCAIPHTSAATRYVCFAMQSCNRMGVVRGSVFSHKQLTPPATRT